MAEQDGERSWVYAARVRGRFQRYHRVSGVLLQVVLFATPWLVIGGHPALLFDLPGRQLHAFGAIFTSSDTFFLVLIGLFSALALFFVTSLVGRLWCGYACPQTVFLEEWVRPLETWWEGDRGARRARDNRPWLPFFGKGGRNGLDKTWRKAGKLASFAVLGAVVSLTAMSYFVDARVLWTGGASATVYGITAAVAATAFADLAWFREQWCNYVCPYARFQGALTDDHSLVVSYDIPRGEPRAKATARKALDLAAAAGAPNANPGACIDCGKCVAVCPQGIDIRTGYQLECVNCARCVDACEGVMEKLGAPSLIRYTTVAADEGRKSRWLRPRTVGYGAMMAGLATVFFAMLATRHDFEATANRVPGALYTLDEDGYVRNTFLLHLTNNHSGDADSQRDFAVEVFGLPDDAEVMVPDISLLPEQTVKVPLVIRVPLSQTLPRTVPIRIAVQATVAGGEPDNLDVQTTFKTGATPGSSES